MSLIRSASPAVIRNRPPQSQRPSGDDSVRTSPHVEAFRAAWRLQDLQCRAFRRRTPSGELEAEVQCVRQDRRELTNLHANAKHPLPRGTIDAGLDNRGGEAQLMHPGCSTNSWQLVAAQQVQRARAADDAGQQDGARRRWTPRDR